MQRYHVRLVYVTKTRCVDCGAWIVATSEDAAIEKARRKLINGHRGRFFHSAYVDATEPLIAAPTDV